MFSSFSTTVATPRKWPGRRSPSSGAGHGARRPPRSWRPAGTSPPAVGHEQEVAAGVAQQARGRARGRAGSGARSSLRAELGGVHEEAGRHVRVLARGRARPARRGPRAGSPWSARGPRSPASADAPGAHLRDGRGLVQDSALRSARGRERRAPVAPSRALTGVGTPRRRPSRTTAPFRASISVRAPRSRSCSIDERFAAVRRATASASTAGSPGSATPRAARHRRHLAGGRLRERARLRIVEQRAVGDAEQRGQRVDARSSRPACARRAARGRRRSRSAGPARASASRQGRERAATAAPPARRGPGTRGPGRARAAWRRAS